MSSQSLPKDLPMDHPSLERLSLDRLPPELLESILSKLDSISSLRCAALACRRLWNVGTSSQIISDILLRQLDNDNVRHQAIATWHIQKLPCPAPRAQFLGYLDDFLKSETQDTSSLLFTIKQAMELETLYRTVRELCSVFIKDCLDKKARKLRNNDDTDTKIWSASTNEITRVRRAFYLAECYFISFRNPFSDAIMDEMIPFFFRSHLATWEIEVLHCVDRFLYYKLLDELTLHINCDLKWQSVVKQNPYFKTETLRRTLSLGLEFVQGALMSGALESTASKTWDKWLNNDELIAIELTHGKPDLSRRGLRCLVRGPYERLSSTAEMLAALASTIDLEDEAQINEQTEKARNKSPFVLSSEGDPPSMIISKWLKWFVTFPERDDDIFLRHYTELCRRGFALWDADRIPTLQAQFQSYG